LNASDTIGLIRNELRANRVQCQYIGASRVVDIVNTRIVWLGGNINAQRNRVDGNQIPGLRNDGFDDELKSIGH
jgi:hypothetical protein